MVFDIVHTTRYKYENGASFCHNLATLKPKSFFGQSLLDYNLEISPVPTDISHRVDFFGNTITRFSIQQYHEELEVTARSKVFRDYSKQNSITDFNASNKVTLKDAIKKLKGIQPEILEIKQFKLDSPLISNISKEIKKYAQVSFKPNRAIFEASYELTQRIFSDFDFDSSFSTIATPLNEVMGEKKGVCQDFAQIAIACLRSVGLASRYVSGYIETLPPEGKEKLVGTDASHAWFSVYIPAFGWVDFDPTNNQIPKNQHIIVAHGRDYLDVPPLKGVTYSSGENNMEVSVDIRPSLEQTQSQSQTQSQ
ncbi:Transglutaminase-like enzyme, putative cysteine protease [Lutibacter agarilyticus]|uniref:Transglutaminase-like enzyme, putative cysteine protease n=1 Tax=Lutibacter agarilyticus TaxID=1109740 RepID=A0A238XU19_9FLAO|nr:transglutaminase family protein [Lutibacter agarilyticus]SNR62202.1 Transglutaminase-like enzyme, putative cysteine protease [Lutibacter agarilyticus]